MSVTRNRRPSVIEQDPRRPDRTPLLRPLEDRTTALEASATSDDARLDALEALAIVEDGRLDALEAADVALDGRLDVLEALAVVEDGRLDALEAADVVLDGRVDTLETDLDAAEALLADHNTRHEAGGADAIKLDDLAAPDDNTDLNASTTAHGLAPKATAPAAGLRSVLAIDNGETVRSDKALFDATVPAALAAAAATGSAMTAARRDHVHPLPDVQDLGDVEFGSWTPGVGGNGGESGQTYGVQVGRYIKTGRQVVAWGRITLTAKGTITSFVEITGFPYQSSNVSNLYGAGLMPYWAALTTAVVHLSIAVNINATRAALYATTAAAVAAGTLAQADLSDTTDLIFSVTYLTD